MPSPTTNSVNAAHQIFESVPAHALPKGTQSSLQLPEGGRLLHVTYNTTNNIKEAPKHPVADILHACGRLALSVATVACAIISVQRNTVHTAFQNVFQTLANILNNK